MLVNQKIKSSIVVFFILGILTFSIPNQKISLILINLVLVASYPLLRNWYFLGFIFSNIFLYLYIFEINIFFFYVTLLISLFLILGITLFVRSDIKAILENKTFFDFDTLDNKTILLNMFLFIFIIISQNDILRFETIDSDINSYLVMSREIMRGNIPFDGQWESKSPLLYLIYAGLIFLSQSNLVYFKLINDIFLFILAYLLQVVIFSKTKNRALSFKVSLFFALFISLDWAKTEYSEIYVLLFLILSYLTFIKKDSNSNIFISGAFLSLATLVNQGSGLYALLFIYLIYKKHKIKTSKYLTFIFGLSVPHLIFLIFYLINNLFDIYIVTLFKIPFLYTGTDFNFINEIIVFLRTVFDVNIFLFTLVIFVTYICVVFPTINLLKSNFTEKILKFDPELFILCVISILYFYSAGKGYYHHLILLIYFLPLLIGQIKSNTINLIISILLLGGVSLNFYQNTQQSVNNLIDMNVIQEEYPLYQLSKEIDSYFNNEYDVLALEYNLILFYLDKPNFSYIVHPSNNYEDFVTNDLVLLNKITENQIVDSINKKPDVVICTGTEIIAGEVVKNEVFNCEVSDYYREYLKLDTSIYKSNPNLEFYKDPYSEIGVYLKIYSCKEVECTTY